MGATTCLCVGWFIQWSKHSQAIVVIHNVYAQIPAESVGTMFLTEWQEILYPTWGELPANPHSSVPSLGLMSQGAPNCGGRGPFSALLLRHQAVAF